ncbi:MAG: DUF362 domain-containing protein [Verrucomicrobiales bacterium]|nr:DUF362 domain-containing protein [Verrucomicrobiales bacterium]
MQSRNRWSRREWLGAAALAGLSLPRLVRSAEVTSKSSRSKLGMPGLYPGRVVVASHPGCLLDGKFYADPIRRLLNEGMMELTDADEPTDAWRQFFEPGDVVGIKLTPVGGPLVMSGPEVLQGIVAGLESAGVRRKDIVVYDRYRQQFLQNGMDTWLPSGVRWSSASEDYTEIQQDMAGYDPDHYLDLAVVLPGQDATNPSARRSYAAKFITREVNKLINLPALKDHQSAGITLALKNLSHGLVNNVSRTHSSSTLNVCGAFIPAAVSLPVIRDKTVLHILDGIRALYHGGPSARPEFVWEHRTLYFATDPVALDRVGWRDLDKKRVAMGMKPIADSKPDKFSTFLNRQPEHVEIAGSLGLGIWEERRIDVRSRQLKG